MLGFFFVLQVSCPGAHHPAAAGPRPPATRVPPQPRERAPKFRTADPGNDPPPLCPASPPQTTSVPPSEGLLRICVDASGCNEQTNSKRRTLASNVAAFSSFLLILSAGKLAFFAILEQTILPTTTDKVEYSFVDLKMKFAVKL